MEPISTDHVNLPRRVSVVGPGRLGRSIAATFEVAGIQVLGPVGRGQDIPRADAVLLCVPDAEIPAAAAAAADAAPLIGHTSGATPLSALAPAGGERFGLHPLQTFAGHEGPARFAGAGCAVAGSTGQALAAARALALAIGLLPFELADEHRAAYHAAASIASNFLVTLQATAERVAAGAGLEADQARALLAPLVRATVENWAEQGPAQALTGPVARGDADTVARQRQAVAETAEELLPLFDAMVARTEALAGVPA